MQWALALMLVEHSCGCRFTRPQVARSVGSNTPSTALMLELRQRQIIEAGASNAALHQGSAKMIDPLSQQAMYPYVDFDAIDSMYVDERTTVSRISYLVSRTIVRWASDTLVSYLRFGMHCGSSWYCWSYVH